MTLEYYTNLENTEVPLNVTIGGVPLAPTFETIDPKADGAYRTGVPAAFGYVLRKDIETKDPVCDIRVNFVPDWIVDGMAVTVEVGYNTYTTRRFTGTVQNLQHAIGLQTIQCHGQLWLLVRQLDAPEVDVTGMTVDEAIRSRLEFVGITNHLIGISSFELGQATPALLPEGQTLNQVAQLADINDGVLYELGSGQIVGVGEMYFLPAPTPYKIYMTRNQGTELLYVKILDGSDHEDPNYFRDYVTATGAEIPDGDPDDPDTTFTPLESSPAVLVGASIRQPPAPAGVFSKQQFSNDLIDVQSELDLYARRKLTKLARIPRYLQIELVGNPLIELGMTLEIISPELNVTGMWFVAALTEECSRRGLRTTCELTGGSRFGGTIQQAPTAAFTYTSVQQVLNDRLVTIVTADATTSFDPDGSIVSYAWSGAGTGNGVRFVFIIDQDATPSPDLTLTVTDNTGLTGERTETINTDPTNGASFIPQPSVWVSGGDGGADSTPDGGLNWNTFALAGATAVDAKPTNGVDTGVAVHGFDDGSLYRTTDFDLNATQAFVGAGDAITVVWWDKIVPTRCWAATLNGAVLLSEDDGATFEEYLAATGYPVWWLATPIPGGIWKGGGRGDQPDTLIQYDPVVGGHNWQSVPFGGECDLTGATEALTCAAAAARVANELAIGFKGELAPAGTNVFHTYTIFVGTGWKKAGGLDGKEPVAFVVPDFPPNVFHVGYSDEQSVYHTLDAINYTETPDVFEPGFTPNQALWEGDLLGGLDGIFLVALSNDAGDGAVVKSKDGLETSEPFYPIAGISTIPAGTQALAIAIGAPGNTVLAGHVAIAGDDYRIDEFNGSSNWTTLRAPDTDTNLDYLKRFFSGAFLGFRINRTLLYSGPTDPGFAEVIAWSSGYVVRGFDIGATGIVWAVKARNSVGGNQATTPLEVYRSDDEGATMPLSHTDPGNGANNNAVPSSCHTAIVADKWNENNIFIACIAGVAGAATRIWTIDGGDNWNVATTVDIPMVEEFSQQMSFANSGRIVLSAQSVTGGGALYTDDFGENWIACEGTLNIQNGVLIAPYRTNHYNRGILAFDSTAGSGVTDEIWFTRDNWETLTPSGIPAFGVSLGGLEYDAPNDRLYINTSFGVFVVDGAFDGDQVVTDITFALATPLGATNGLVLPR